MDVIRTGISAFLLREQPFERFRFSRWQSYFVITLLGVLQGLAWYMHGHALKASHLALPTLLVKVLFGVLLTWAAFSIIHRACRWWLMRGERWDGKDDLFNLMAASWLLPFALLYGLYALDVPGILLVPIEIYAIWVNANAMSGAVPKATLGYSIAGIVNGLVLIYVLLFGLAIVLAFIKLVLQSGGAVPSAAGRP
ncbi:hypothetical protein [Lautropia mirabilis]|uniref:hypothetical protein n=1 Tax=Lautropia mirabilis TaxID=47671 RepID=UPI0028EE92F8|nr:hypothetical protein [Lautropia mirabilis]